MSNEFYRIECISTNQMVERMGFLFRKGMVFTGDRVNDILDVREQYGDFNSWRYIFFGQSKICKKIFNTGCSKNPGYIRDDVEIKYTTITCDDFVRDVLPTL